MLSLPPAFVLSQDQTLKLKGLAPFLTFEPSHIVIHSMRPDPSQDRIPPSDEADYAIIGGSHHLGADMLRSVRRENDAEPPAYPFSHRLLKERGRNKPWRLEGASDPSLPDFVPGEPWPFGPCPPGRR